MSSKLLSRRHFLTLSLLGLLGPTPGARAEPAHRQRALDVDVGLLYSTLALGLRGTLDEAVDRRAGRYEISASGQGRGLASRLQSRGVERAGRWAPVHATAWFQYAGREARTELTYDYDRRHVHYQYRGETFFRRRQRVVDDLLAIPDGQHLDDVMSATLNYAEGRWPPAPDGAYRTSIVRRRRPENEDPDEVQAAYRAEIAPLVLQITTDAQTGKPVATFDLAPLSSWARQNQPGRVVFGSDRRPETVTASLILGTSINIRFTPS